MGALNLVSRVKFCTIRRDLLMTSYFFPASSRQILIEYDIPTHDFHCGEINTREPRASVNEEVFNHSVATMEIGSIYVIKFIFITSS